MKDFEIQDHLTERCRDKNISIAELARQTGIDYTGICKRNNFRLRNICKMLIILDCKFEDLFEIIEKEQL